MLKRKVKLEIIDEYIEISKLEILVKTRKNFKIKSNLTKIKDKYEKILLRLGLIDNSLENLKLNLFEMENRLKDIAISAELLTSLDSKIEAISLNLPQKLNILGLNDAEKNYILSN